MHGPKVRRETSAGGVIVRLDADEPRYLLIYDGHGNWGFPKGHLERGESPTEAAIREIAEETGLRRVVLLRSLGQGEWSFRKKAATVQKRCFFFLFQAHGGAVTTRREEGITDYRWMPYDAARKHLTFDTQREVLDRAAQALAATSRAGIARG